MKRLLALILMCLLAPHSAFAAWTAIDDIDSYADADLTGRNGGSGWSSAYSGNVLYDTQGTTVLQGTKAIQLSANATEPDMIRSYTAITDGILHYAFRRTSTTAGTFSIYVTSGATADYANRAFDITWNNSAQTVALGSSGTTIQNSYGVG